MLEIGNSWDEILYDELHSPQAERLWEFLRQEYQSGRVYPPREDVFNALRLTPYENVKAVIVGQDPYHGEGQAHGLCFSVRKGTPLPPSLRNIFRELWDDLGITPPPHGELTAWARQGVLLINAVLTVREGKPNSHRGKGWEQITDTVIRKLGERDTPTAFILWGANARAKEKLIENPRHAVFTAAHPSPLSAHSGFFGCRHFSAVNEFLVQSGIEPINWQIT